MYCRYCGKQVLDDSAYCHFCGKSLGAPEEKATSQIKSNILTEKSVSTHSDEIFAYYEKRANNIASSSLKKATKILSYAALVTFLFFNIKMAPMYGLAKFFWYIITSAIAIGIVLLFNKKVVAIESKKLYITYLMLSLVVIAVSISLRIVYEAKIDYVKKHAHPSGEIYVILSEETVNYDLMGMGKVTDSITDIKVNDKWYDSGDIVRITLNENYSLRVDTGGLGSDKYVYKTLTITNSSFANGEYVFSEYIYSGFLLKAEVNFTFTRHCTFWEVVFY